MFPVFVWWSHTSVSVAEILLTYDLMALQGLVVYFDFYKSMYRGMGWRIEGFNNRK